MNGGPSKQFKPTEPNENRGGFRKVKRGEGRSTVRGNLSPGATDRKMKILGWILLGMALLFPVGFLVGGLAGWNWLGFVAVSSFVLAHLFLMVSEMTTHREVPTRKKAMLILWGSLGLMIAIGFVVSLF